MGRKVAYALNRGLSVIVRRCSFIVSNPAFKAPPVSTLEATIQVDSFKSCVQSAYGVNCQRLQLQYDEPLSDLAFNFNVRRYTLACCGETSEEREAGRCTLTVSKARVESAFGFSA